jgi:GT2 family glycosyltransferase
MNVAAIDIIYCFRDRDPVRIERSLRSLDAQEDRDFSVIFIDYGSHPLLSERIEKICSGFAFCRYHYVDSLGKMWNRSDALNHGIFLSKAENVFTADADLLFLPGFITRLKAISKGDAVAFFQVGYLSERVTSRIGDIPHGKLPYTRSEDFALGMMLAKTATLKAVNGYNAFYALWGMEDNDMKFRLNSAGFETRLISEVHILHQYHPPANRENEDLPPGWRQLMKDYHDNYAKQPHPFPGLDRVQYPARRPVRGLLGVNATSLPYRELYIRHRVYNDFRQLRAGDALSYSIPLKQARNSGMIRFTGLLNRFFKGTGLPLVTSSIYRTQYAEKSDILNALHVLVKMLEEEIEDYAIDAGENEVTFKIVKR